MAVSPLKTSYQKSIVAGLLASSLVLIASALFLTSTSSIERPVYIRSDKSIYTIVWVEDRYQTQDQNASGDTPPVATSSRADIRKDVPVDQSDSSSPPEIMGTRTEFALAQYISGTYGMNTSILVPKQDAPEFVPMPGDGLTYGRFSNGTQGIEAQMGNMRHQPLFIKLYSLKIPDQCKVSQDTVIVLLNIDDDARIKSIETIYDSSPGNGFDVSFKNSIRLAYIRPEIIDGSPVGGSYYIYWIWGEHGRVGVKSTEKVRIQMAQPTPVGL